MKLILFFQVLFIGFSSFAYLPKEDPKDKQNVRYELLKCNSAKHGTIWASFGHLMTSNSNEVVYFPTEIVHFANFTAPASRLVFMNYKDALKIEVNVRSTGMSFTFDLNGAAGPQTHKVQLIPIPKSDNGFAGNWSVIDNGWETPDQVYCSIH